MPSEVFLRADMRYVSRGLADNTGHSGISNFEMSLGLQTTGNKGDRAAQVVRHIFEQQETDLLLVELLNFLYVESAYADHALGTDAYSQLRDNVLEPRGVELSAQGFTLPDGRGVEALRAAVQVWRTGAPSRPEATTAPAPLSTSTPEETVPAITRDTSKVFVVHGRDTRPVDVVKQCLFISAST